MTSAVLYLLFVRPEGTRFLRSQSAKTKNRYNGKYHAAAGEKAFVCGTA